MAASPDLWLYFLLVFGIIVLPGMDMAYVATHALVGGLRSGLTAVGGMVTGGLVHMAAAATGLGALITLWPGAFDGLLVAGAAYMVWIGWTLLRASRVTADAAGLAVSTPAAPGEPRGTAVPGALHVYRRAVLTCLMNPKAYAFTLAVLPAYLATAERPLAAQAVLLSAITAATQFAVYGAVAATAASTRRFAGVGAHGERWMLRVTGPLLMAGAVLTLVLGWQPARAQPAAPALPTAAAPSTPAAHDGRHDFDFLVGHWRIANRKRVSIFKNDDRWESFEAESHASPLAGGIGNTDTYVAPAWRPGYLGATFRFYHPKSQRWSLYWVTNTGVGLSAETGLLDEPVVGRFEGDVGVFEGNDTWDGKPIRVRYTWRRVDADHARWEQAFSPDTGKSWETNWTMELTRVKS